VPNPLRVPNPRRLSQEVGEWWRYVGVKQILGYFCAAGGIGLTLATALTKGPNQLLLAVIAVFAQGIAAFLFAGHGKAQPAYAQRAVSRLLGLAERSNNATVIASASFESKSVTPTQRRDDLGFLSSELSWISEGLRDAVADWIAINEPLVELITEEMRQEILRQARESKSDASPSVDPADQISDDRLEQLSSSMTQQLASGEKIDDRA
jgi:hypothetical protein